MKKTEKRREVAKGFVAVAPKMATTDSGVVINELLCFVANKMECLPPETICQLCLNTFSETDIESSKKQLFDLCSDENTPRIIHRKGPKKSNQNLEDIVKLMHERSSDIPTFVALNLQALPPVTFNSIDVSSLLNAIKKTQVEVDLLKQGMSAQAQTIKDLKCIVEEKQATSLSVDSETTDTSKLQVVVSATEVKVPTVLNDADNTSVLAPSTPSEHVPTQEMVSDPAVDTPVKRAGVQASSESVPQPHEDPAETPGRPPSTAAGQHKDGTKDDVKTVAEEGGESHENNVTNAGSYADKVSAWKTMMVVSGKLKAVPSGSAPPSTVAATGGKKDSLSRKNGLVSGAAKDSGIGTVKKVSKEKYASIFASRFSTDVSDRQLKSYLEGKLPGHDIVVNSVKTRYDTYRSFHIWCACPNPLVLLKEEVWPEGAYVRWWKGELPQPQ